MTHDSIEDARTALRLYRRYQELKAKGDDFFNDSLQVIALLNVRDLQCWSRVFIRNCTMSDVVCNGQYRACKKSRIQRPTQKRPSLSELFWLIRLHDAVWQWWRERPMASDRSPRNFRSFKRNGRMAVVTRSYRRHKSEFIPVSSMKIHVQKYRLSICRFWLLNSLRRSHTQTSFYF